MSTATSAPVLECSALSVRVPGRELVRDLDAAFRAGETVAILGRNGAGKSSLLHVLAGQRQASSGSVHLHGRPLADWNRRDLARHLGLLPQVEEDPFPGTVLETALVGRHPHLGYWAWESATDLGVARSCLAAMDLAGLDERDVSSLSGGERRRLAVATLLAQDPALLLLDEPIQQLDPQHQIAVLDLFKAMAKSGRCVLMSLHDVGLATRYADRSLLLFGDGRWSFGPSAEILNEDSISRLYGIDVRELRWDRGRTFVPA